MLNRMCMNPCVSCRKRYVTSCQIQPFVITASGDNPKSETIGSRKYENTNTPTFVYTSALTAGVIGPGPIAYVGPEGAYRLTGSDASRSPAAKLEAAEDPAH